MGTYVTTTSLETLLQGVTFNTATTSLATLCIEDAENEVNKFLSKRYSVPFDTFTSTPPIIKSLCRRLACYYVLTSLFTQDSQNTEAWATEFYEKPMEELKDIRDGKVDILNTAGSALSEINTSYAIQSNTKDYHPTFDLDEDTNWEIDDDRLTDIRNEK